MTGPSSPLIRSRIFDAFGGATVGVLAAVAIIAAETPRVAGGHPTVFILACAVVGAAVGLAGLLRLASYAAAFVAALVLVVTITPAMSPLVRTLVRQDPAPRAPLER
jgi:hypothetical protein